MTSEQVVAFAPAPMSLMMAWFCGRGDFWRTLRCASFVFVSLVMTTQYSGWAIGWVQMIAPQLDHHLLQGAVLCVMTIGLYGLWWLLYHRLWQPSSSPSAGKNWWLYAVVGLLIGWGFGVVIVQHLTVSELIDLGRLYIPQYSAAMEATHEIIMRQVEIFVP